MPGTWLKDLNSQHGNQLSLSGVDLSAHLFCGNSSGADLRAHDIREPFPREWKWSNTFDCVHQRWLIWGLASAEWPAVVHNLVELVKPGGYVQLVEAEWILPEVSDQQPEQKKLNLVQSWSTESFGMDIHIWNKLAPLLRAEGCEDIVEESFDLGYGATATRPEDRDVSAELWAESFRHLAGKISGECNPPIFQWRTPTLTLSKEAGIPGVAKSADDYHAFLDRLVIELKLLGYTPKIKWIVGRKPGTSQQRV